MAFPPPLSPLHARLEFYAPLSAGFTLSCAGERCRRPSPPPPPKTLAPVITPILPNADIDAARLLTLCTWLQQRSVGLAVFNTNSEGNSFSLRQKSAALAHLVRGGVQPSKLILPGIGSCSVDESVQLARAALDNGISNMLLLPPWYYNTPAFLSDEGLCRFFAATIDKIAPSSPPQNLFIQHVM
jgi:4-hydroxy-tetrahydrodipicolinate synthase